MLGLKSSGNFHWVNTLKSIDLVAYLAERNQVYLGMGPCKLPSFTPQNNGT